MSSNMQFFIGLAFAIPFSIIANLATPKIQNFLAKRFEFAAKRNHIRKEQELKRISLYVNQPEKLNTYLLTILLASTMITCFIGVISTILYMLGLFSNQTLSSVFAQAITIFGGLMATKICFDSIKLVVKVRETEVGSNNGS